MTFTEISKQGKMIVFMREHEETWDVAYTNFIKGYITNRYEGPVNNTMVDLDAMDIHGIHATAGPIERYISARLKGHEENENQPSLKSFAPKPYKTKAVSGKKEDDGGIKWGTSIGTLESLYQTPSSLKEKKNLYEDLQEDEVVVNVEELADLFAREVLEIQNLIYERNIERYKFLVAKYMTFIKSVKKHES